MTLELVVLYVVIGYLFVRRCWDDYKGPPRWIISNLDEATAAATTPGVAVDHEAAAARKIRLSPLAQENPFMAPANLDMFPPELP